MTDIKRARGDTIPIEISVVDDNGAAVDVSGFSFLLTVDPSSKPTDASNNLFQLTGTITDAVNGVVQFSLTESQADNVGNNFYDIQQTDTAGNIFTLVSGRFTLVQDITK